MGIKAIAMWLANNNMEDAMQFINSTEVFKQNNCQADLPDNSEYLSFCSSHVLCFTLLIVKGNKEHGTPEVNGQWKLHLKHYTLFEFLHLELRALWPG